MNKIIFTISVILGFVVGVYAGQNFESVTVSSTTAAGLTASNYAASSTRTVPKKALLTVEGQNIRFRYDGTAISSTTLQGHRVLVDDVVEVEGTDNMARLSMISIGAGNATVRVSYE